MEVHENTHGSLEITDVPESGIALHERQRSRRHKWLTALALLILVGSVFVFLLVSGRFVTGRTSYERAVATPARAVDNAQVISAIPHVAGVASADPALAAELATLQDALATLSSILSTVGNPNAASAAATNPTVIRETIRTVGGGSIDTSQLVARGLFDAQVNGTNHSIESLGDGISSGIAESISTAALTVAGDTALSGVLAAATTTLSTLTVTGTTTFQDALSLTSLAGGILTTDASGLVSTTTIGAASIIDDSLDFTQLRDTLTVDATTSFDLDTNGADLNFDSGTLFVDSSANRVGIGTTTPRFTLDVGGNLGVQGALEIDNTLSTRNFTLQSANTSVPFPVPTFKPTTADSVLALDLFPNGSPDEEAAGFAWIDVCDSAGVTTCARIGATSAGTVFGNNSFNGAAPKPTIFKANGVEGFRIDTSGRLGIGTSTPGSKLSIGGNGGIAIGQAYSGLSAPIGGLIAQGKIGIGTTTPDEELVISSSALTRAVIETTGNSDPALILRHPGQSWSLGIDNSINQNFSINTGEVVDGSAFVIDANGHVGIGVTLPTSLLTLKGTGGSTQGIQIKNSYDTMAFQFGGDADNSNFIISYSGSGISDFVIESDGDTHLSNLLNVYVSSGRIGVGTTTPGQELVVDGTIQSTDLLGGATNITTDASGNIIRDPSDVRLKTNIADIYDALDKLLALHGVSYEWKDKSRFGSQTEIGFIAQEVDPILPEVVRKGGDYWSINTRNILAVVVEGFKDFYAEFVALRNTVRGFARSFTSEQITGEHITTGELCVDDICVTRDEFAAMIAVSGGDPESPAPPEDSIAEPDETIADPTPASLEFDNGVATTTPDIIADEPPAALPAKDEPDTDLVTLEESPSIETPDAPIEEDAVVVEEAVDRKSP